MGKTPSGNTGPETDHTTLRFGEFMLVAFNPHSNYQMVVNVFKVRPHRYQILKRLSILNFSTVKL